MAAGMITLEQKDGYIQLSGEFTGLSQGEHGFHIHMFGDLRSADASSAGGHYNPTSHQHGGPESAEHNEGDLGNIKANSNGVAKVDVNLKGIDIHALLGRSLVVHRGPDDFKSQPAGNSGPRIAVGVIGYAEVKPAANSAGPTAK